MTFPTRRGADAASTVPASAAAVAAAEAEAALDRLPPRLRRWLAWLLSRYPGRILLSTGTTCVRIEIFDRSMTIAAQFFTSIFPLLILVASWGSLRDTEAIEDAVDLPEATKSLLEPAVETSGGAAFGIVGTLIVLASATSLSRALTRAFAAVWDLPRPKSRLASAWRWLAVVLALALAMVAVRALKSYAAEIPPSNVWQVTVSLVCDLAIGVFVPWVLLSGVVRPRHLAPGALLFGLAMLAVRPASGVWLPRALDVSAERYGSIGVAFTYLAWLYVVSFCFLATAAVGQVITTDRGQIGAWLRGQAPGEAPVTGAAA